MYNPGTIIGQDYVIERLIGKGGMGVVYEATHRIMQQRFAVKVLSADQLSEQNWMRFQREAQALARLNHQNIVKVFNLGIDRESYPYYVMELLAGESLQDKLKREGSLPVSECLEIFVAVAEGLAAAHRAKIIHRDIKPANIMLCPSAKSGQTAVKLVDFGLARLGQDAINARPDSERSKLLQNLTEVGEVFGSPLYMSPEQAAGGRLVDERSDIYSFGCSLFEALTGRVPFHGRTVMETFSLHQNQKAPSLQKSNREGVYPLELELAVARMMEKSPEKRYQSMESLLVDLHRVQEGKPVGAAVRSIDQSTAGGELYDDEEERAAHSETTEANGLSARAVKMAITFIAILVTAGILISSQFKPAKEARIKEIDRVSLPEVMKPTEIKDEDKAESRIDKVSLIKRAVTKDGRLKFTFPGSSFVQAKIAGTSGKDGDIHCEGPVVVRPPLHTRFSFFSTPPEFLAAFAKDDIDDFTLSEIIDEREWQRLFKQLAGWKKIKRLDLRDSVISNKEVLLPVDNFPKLDSLEFRRCTVDADFIKDLKVLKRLSNFTFDLSASSSDSGTRFAFAKLFDSLSGSKNLRAMQVTMQNADAPDDISHLQNLPNLAFFIIKGTKWTEKKVDAICTLSGLRTIIVHSKELTPELLARFQKSNSIEEIVVEFSLEPNHLYDKQVLRNKRGAVIKVREDERTADLEENEKQWQKEHPESVKISI